MVIRARDADATGRGTAVMPIALYIALHIALVLLVAMVSGSPATALASGTVREISLDEVLRTADVAVVVRLAQPPAKAVHIPITPKGARPDAKRWPAERDRVAAGDHRAARACPEAGCWAVDGGPRQPLN